LVSESLSTAAPQASSSASSEKPDWVAIELAMVKKLWLPDAEILKLKSFHSLVVLDNLQVSVRRGKGIFPLSCSVEKGVKKANENWYSKISLRAFKDTMKSLNILKALFKLLCI